MADEDESLEESCRRESIQCLRHAEATLASGRACGVIVIAVDSDGFVRSWRNFPGTRYAYAEACAALDHISSELHEKWLGAATQPEKPLDGATLEPVPDDTQDPEEV